MDCYYHQGVESVGNCVSCGRPICSACAHTIEGRLTCRDCSSATSSSGWLEGPDITGERKHTPHKPQATPTGTPNQQLFKIGGIGTLIMAGIAMLTSSLFFLVLMGQINFELYYTLNTLTSVVSIIGGLLFAIGLYGFSKNYGLGIGKIAAILEILMSSFGVLAALLLATIPVMIGFNQSISLVPLQFIEVLLLLAFMGLVGLAEIALVALVFYQAREFTGIEQITSGAAIVYALGFFIGSLIPFITALSYLLFTYVFFKAEIPTGEAWLQQQTYSDW